MANLLQEQIDRIQQYEFTSELERTRQLRNAINGFLQKRVEDPRRSGGFPPGDGRSSAGNYNVTPSKLEPNPLNHVTDRRDSEGNRRESLTRTLPSPQRGLTDEEKARQIKSKLLLFAKINPCTPVAISEVQRRQSLLYSPAASERMSVVSPTASLSSPGRRSSPTHLHAYRPPTPPQTSPEKETSVSRAKSDTHSPRDEQLLHTPPPPFVEDKPAPEFDAAYSPESSSVGVPRHASSPMWHGRSDYDFDVHSSTNSLDAPASSHEDHFNIPLIPKPAVLPLLDSLMSGAIGECERAFDPPTQPLAALIAPAAGVRLSQTIPTPAARLQRAEGPRKTPPSSSHTGASQTFPGKRSITTHPGRISAKGSIIENNVSYTVDPTTRSAGDKIVEDEWIPLPLGSAKAKPRATALGQSGLKEYSFSSSVSLSSKSSGVGDDGGEGKRLSNLNILNQEAESPTDTTLRSVANCSWSLDRTIAESCEGNSLDGEVVDDPKAFAESIVWTHNEWNEQKQTPVSLERPLSIAEAQHIQRSLLANAAAEHASKLQKDLCRTASSDDIYRAMSRSGSLQRDLSKVVTVGRTNSELRVERALKHRSEGSIHLDQHSVRRSALGVVSTYRNSISRRNIQHSEFPLVSVESSTHSDFPSTGMPNTQAVPIPRSLRSVISSEDSQPSDAKHLSRSANSQQPHRNEEPLFEPEEGSARRPAVDPTGAFGNSVHEVEQWNLPPRHDDFEIELESYSTSVAYSNEARPSRIAAQLLMGAEDIDDDDEWM